MKLLDYDAFSGVTRYMSSHHDIGKNVIHSVMDVEPHLDFIKTAAECWDKKRNMWYVGSIPPIICELWAQESGQRIFSKGWQDYAAKQLNLPENRKMNPNKIRLKRSS